MKSFSLQLMHIKQRTLKGALTRVRFAASNRRKNPHQMVYSAAKSAAVYKERDLKKKKGLKPFHIKPKKGKSDVTDNAFCELGTSSGLIQTCGGAQCTKRQKILIN